MNESENYLDQLLNAVDGRSDLNDSDPVNPEEIESKEQMPQKSTRETIDIPVPMICLWISLNRNSGKIMIPMNF